MASWVDTPTRTFEAGEAIDQYIRVYLSSGKLAIAGIAAEDLGQAEVEAFADGDHIAVRLVTACGTCKMVAADTFDLGAKVYTAALGKISDTAGAGSRFLGLALEAATAAGDIVEVLRRCSGDTSN